MLDNEIKIIFINIITTETKLINKYQMKNKIHVL